MNRYKEIITLIPDDSIDLVKTTVEEVVFLEEQLTALKKLPFIKVNSSNIEQQKTTPAYKQYKELLQQYTNCIKLLEGVIYRDKKLEGVEVEDSPLRKWFKNYEMD